ncbi:hypothetical protein WH47_02925 [Habropoda laboriosa]|uniref:XRCC4 coiled-coil domain-containing protein n=1 Tax=Habropoda laboriosa TaxID=597456 RepID=A0A0L7QY93_9HYME|nr:PREDICTED: uncharacterized protein LOC108573972 [Habropoda laboriosa]KOC63529.1 hypothetical protein WH47_02925 [Habropoda laboriosa]
MIKVTAREIFNQVDNKCHTLYIEWFNSHFKVMLLKSTVSPLYGEMSIKDVNYFCRELSKSTDEYLKETERILCREDKEIIFFIQDKTLEWKKNVWTLGRIELHPILDIKVVCESFQQLLKFYQSSQDKLNMLEEENKNLIDVNKELSLKIEKMIEIKTSMEQNLYKKFIMILNLKKRKVAELEDAIKENPNTKESIFDIYTDESEESEKEEHAANNERTISIRANKRKSLGNNSSKGMRKTKKTDCIINSSTICNISSSKDCGENKEYTLNNYIVEDKKSTYEKQSCSSESRKPRTSLNLIEEESEEELFSQ